MYEVGLFKKDFYDDIVEVGVDESLDAMLALIRKSGVLSGPTGGGSLAAALKYLRPLDAGFEKKQHAVFIVCDRVEWYLSYLQKLRPEMFGVTRKSGVRTLTSEQIDNAPQVDVEEALAMTERTDVIVIDLRGPLAFKAGRIAGAINISVDHFEGMCDQGVPFSGGKKVLIVCPVGDQSRRFAAYLSKAGVSCVSMKGGMAAWNAAGNPSERNSSRVLSGVR
jgi:cysteine synthase B